MARKAKNNYVCRRCGKKLHTYNWLFKMVKGRMYSRKRCRRCLAIEHKEWRDRTSYNSKYYKRNREKILTRTKCWQANHRSMLKSYAFKMRPRTRVTRYGIPYDEFVSLWESVGGICYICNLKVPLDKVSVDHVVPLIRGGVNAIGNILPTHRGCNAAKCDYGIEEVLSWRQ